MEVEATILHLQEEAIDTDYKNIGKENLLINLLAPAPSFRFTTVK